MRISTTTLESFRLFMDPDQEWMSEDDLVATIRGTTPTSPAMELGLAFENVLQDPDRYRVRGGYRYGGYTFDDQTMQSALDLIDRRGLFQVKTEKRYGDIDVVSKCDHIVGARIDEFKTTTSTFDADKYLASYQWRYMLDAFSAELVRYYVFQLDDHENGVVELRDIHPLHVYPYPELHADCQALLDRFVHYVTMKGLDALLRQRQADAASAA